MRGYRHQRFAGDAMVYGGAELRSPVTEAVLLLRGTLGGHVLADAGRVYFEGRSTGGWHSALGGGLWFLFQIRNSPFAVSATYARGEESGRFYLDLGMPF